MKEMPIADTKKTQSCIAYWGLVRFCLVGFESTCSKMSSTCHRELCHSKDGGCPPNAFKEPPQVLCSPMCCSETMESLMPIRDCLPSMWTLHLFCSSRKAQPLLWRWWFTSHFLKFRCSSERNWMFADRSCLPYELWAICKWSKLGDFAAVTSLWLISLCYSQQPLANWLPTGCKVAHFSLATRGCWAIIDWLQCPCDRGTKHSS